ncbi:MAG: electron transfer flavoprotein subunit alpha [Zetaproteobacteria bacterium]|nr:electron transfer flavoprotein subunit alpha [Pseudobdellovibrionaceae bacterium]|tara:strand:- start:134 stop:1114 length:981 start_codon:yes stop_codon:yes gene_type:complete
MKVLVFCEQRDGVLKSSVSEALGVAHKLVNGNSDNVAGLVIGENVSSLTPDLGVFGASKVYTASSPSYKLYNVCHYTDVLENAVKKFQPDVVLGAASPMGRDLFPRAAARLNAGLLTDLTELDYSENSFNGGIKPMYAGKVLANVTYTNNCKLKMATIRPNVFPSEKKSLEATEITLDCSLSDEHSLETKEILKGKTSKADLTESSCIISGGRAMENEENFSVLQECAEVIGATVGASRAAVDSGFAPHEMQVGQTGKTVNPNLYIACGISGSIQHLAGMKTSKVIVAINKDEDAPIFSIADYGIVGDLFEIVPELTKEFKSYVDQ